MRLLFKHFSVIFLSLFIFASNGVTQEASSHHLDRFFLQAVQDGDIGRVTESFRAGVDDVNVIDKFGRTAATLAFQNDKSDVLELLLDRGGYICADYTIDVRPEYVEQTEGENLTINLTGDSLEPSEVRAVRTRLTLLFSLMRHGYNNLSGPFQIEGVGESRSFQFGLPPYISVEERPVGDGDALADAVKDAVRDGYGSLNEAINKGEIEMFRLQKLVSTVNSVQGNRIQVSLGSSDYVQEGDVFNIYLSRRRGQFYSSYYNGCYTPYAHGASIATARVVEIIDGYNSILEVENVRENADGYIQVGNIVALSDDIDLTSRIQGNELHRYVLMVNPIPHTFVRYYDHKKRVTARNITGYLRYFVASEARDFDFRDFRILTHHLY